MLKREFLKLLTVSATTLGGASAALAQGGTRAFPLRPLRFIVPFPAGGISDTLIRTLSASMSKTLGQPIVVDNRPGAGGNLGLGMAAQSPADGYTLVLGATSTISVGPYLYKNLSFDARKDLMPVAFVGTIPNVLVVNKSVPASDLATLIKYLKANPGKINFASPGSGNSSHLAGEMFKQRAGVDIRHIPYKGDVQALTDLIGGHTQMMFATVGAALPHIQAGTLRPIVIAGPNASAALPNVPTIVQEGLAAMDTDAWFGVFAPAHTPDALISQLNRAVNTALAEPEVAARLEGLGLRPAAMSVAKMTDYVELESKKWGELVKQSGASLD